jgi:homoserine kinase type II
MAVFTAVTREALIDWLGRFDVGGLVGFEAIATGIENTNYFVTTAAGRFVLTIFERLRADQLPFYLNLMHHLASRGIPCPDPVADRGGALTSPLHGKPAALVTRLPGHGVPHPGVVHCRQVGELLARMHLVARDYDGHLPNPRGLDWWVATAPRVEPFMRAAAAALLRDEIDAQCRFAQSPDCIALQACVVHADLFRDNVLFEADRLGGVIDFYFAGRDTWLFDLAVTSNDWCIDDGSGTLDDARLQALVGAYQGVRALTSHEHAAWPMMLRAAALRFWVSRLFDLYLPRPAELVTPKDPAHFERILRERRAHVPSLPAIAGKGH